MANPFFVNTIDLLPSTKAKAGDVEANLNGVEAGFDEAKEYFDRTLRGARANPAIPELPSAATRANKALTFDASGNPITTVTTDEISNAQTYATNAANSASAAAVSAGAAAGSAATANAAATDPNVVAVGSDLLGPDTIGTVASDIANVNAVAGNQANINAVAANATNINSVASNAANINTTATNIAAIIDAPNQAAAAAASASAAATSLDSFDDRYLGAKASDPTLDNDGNALLTGALYFNSTVGEMRVWSGSAWIASYLPDGSYQPLLVSGTNIKTINSTSLLGSGNIDLGTVIRIARTSNTQLAAADLGKLIDITSGTFSQTFAAVATLGDGWWCYIRNAGTGDITLDPNASETIDGLTTFVMYPGEVRMVVCDGTAFYSIILNPFYRVFTASGSFIVPPGYKRFEGLLWGGGGKGSLGGGGGGGGACVPFTIAPPTAGSSQTVTIGAGGTTGTSTGQAGGTSTFAGISAFGGGGGYEGSGNNHGGGGGGALGAGATGGVGGGAAGGSPADAAGPNAFGGGKGGSPAGNAAYGGGAGGGSFADSGLKGGDSIYGGGGGGNRTGGGAGGTSVFGGNGGAGSSGTGGAGTAPGGGGGGGGTAGGNGARGELRIWGVV